MRKSFIKADFNILLQVAVLLGADPSKAADDLKESLQFEIELAKISLPREERRNATKLYNPRTLETMHQLFKPGFVKEGEENKGWTNYINRVLTKSVIQV